MKNKIGSIMIACVLLVPFLLGITGTVSFAEEENTEKTGAGKDRLIGVFITAECLDGLDSESLVSENAEDIRFAEELALTNGTSAQEKRYAAAVNEESSEEEAGAGITVQKYVFEGMEGIAFFCARYTDEEGGMQYWRSTADDAVADAHTVFDTTETGESINMTGTVYVSASDGPRVFYFNPVYQSESGEVYLVPGQGMSYGAELSAGISGTYTLKEEQTVMTDGALETVAFGIEVGICFLPTPTGTRILRFDEDGNLLSAKNDAPGELPPEILTTSDTAYLIVETHMRSAQGEETVQRELFCPGDERLFTFYCREDGICIKEYCEIDWN